MYDSVLQLEQPVSKTNNFRINDFDERSIPNNNITIIPNQIRSHNPTWSVYEEIDNNPNITEKEKINKKIKYQNKVDFSHELRKHNLEEYADRINHYTTEMINWEKQQYGIIVDEDTYNNHHYHIGYRRLEDVSRPSGYNTVMLGFAQRSALTYFQPGRKFTNPTYRVELDENSGFIRDINRLYEMLEYDIHQEFVNSHIDKDYLAYVDDFINSVNF